MDHLIIEVLRGGATEAEHRQLQAWREASPENEASFQKVARVWRLSGRAGRKPAYRAAPAAVDLIQRAEARRHARTAPHTGTRRKPLFGWAAATVAAAALLFFGVALGRLVQPDPSGTARFGIAEITTGPGELATARLSDGSVVRLAPESRLRVTDEPTNREAWIDGRAFFAIAEQDGEPFRVRSRAGDALVLGTRFEVQVTGGTDLRVAVLEGRVAVSVGEQQVEVTAGEVGQTVDGEAPTVEEVPDVRPMLNWMGQFLAFQTTPLGQVALELEQQYDVEVRIVDDAIAQRTVTAAFTDESIGEALDVVCRVADVHCSIVGDTAIIEP